MFPGGRRRRSSNIKASSRSLSLRCYESQSRDLDGEAKLQLKERLGRSKELSALVVGIETTDKLTDPQIVAKV